MKIVLNLPLDLFPYIKSLGSQSCQSLFIEPARGGGGGGGGKGEEGEEEFCVPDPL